MFKDSSYLAGRVVFNGNAIYELAVSSLNGWEQRLIVDCKR